MQEAWKRQKGCEPCYVSGGITDYAQEHIPRTEALLCKYVCVSARVFVRQTLALKRTV